MRVDGTCHCGYLTFEAEVDPATVEVCHCTDCQVLSSSAFRIVVPAIQGSFRLLSGEPTIYVKTAESGNKRKQAFCPKCGTPIYSAPTDAGSQYFGLRVGALRQRLELEPRAQYWIRSARPWLAHVSELEAHETE
jgi:hypothetical protein